MEDGSRFSLTAISPVYRMSTTLIQHTLSLLPGYRAYCMGNGLMGREWRGTWDEMLYVLSTLQSKGMISTWGQCCFALLKVQSGDLVLQEDGTGRLRLTPLSVVVQSLTSAMMSG